mmetsp:Transcript_22652/g.32454  ORF Transcript_22652/g.32454 Transcript_22652/m.32454 type:complete len:109 (+) Transcript_22652:85-411(+)
MMFRFLVLSTVLSLAASQIPARMGVCYLPEANEEDVMKHCQTKPDCMYEGDPNDMSCYMRCEDQLDEDELEFNCEDYGMKCYMGVACVLPPQMLDELQEGGRRIRKRR